MNSPDIGRGFLSSDNWECDSIFLGEGCEPIENIRRELAL